MALKLHHCCHPIVNHEQHNQSSLKQTHSIIAIPWTDTKILVHCWYTVRHRSTKTVPTVYQKQSKDSQNSKNNHWCTNRHVYQDCTDSLPIVKISQKTVKQQKMAIGVGLPVVTCLPRLYQPCTKNSQKTPKTAKITIGVPTVTVLPRLYQQCNNSLAIVNKNLAIANRSRVSCQYVEGIHRPKYYTVTLKSRLRVTQGHCMETEPRDRSYTTY